MKYVITFEGGPLDGTHEFIDPSPNEFPPTTDANRFAAWMHLMSTRGEVGNVTKTTSPAMLEALFDKSGTGTEGMKANPHSYVNTASEKRDDTVYVTANHIYQLRPPMV